MPDWARATARKPVPPHDICTILEAYHPDMATPYSSRILWDGYVVGFDVEMTQDSAEEYFFSDGAPDLVTLTPHGYEVGITCQSGVPFPPSVQNVMRPQVYAWMSSSAETGTGTEWKPGDPEPAGGGSSPNPGTVPIHMTQEEIEEWVKQALDGAHAIGSTAEILAIFGGEAVPFLEVLGEVLGPIGDAAMLVIAFIALYEAFGEGRRGQEREGFCYGLMWQACDYSNEDKVFVPWAGDSPEELREAFGHGVHSGRAQGSMVATRNTVLLMVARQQLQVGSDLWAAQANTLGDLGRSMETRSDLQFYWPKPPDMQDR